MNISRVNDLLGQVRMRLESLDAESMDEGIQQMDADDPRSVPSANKRVAHLMSKLTTGRSKSNRVVATGTSRGRR